MDTQDLWDAILAHEGETFYTASKLPFTYRIRGGEFFADRKKKSITRATFERAYEKIQGDTARMIVGPKTLNVFGAPYVGGGFLAMGVVEQEKRRGRTGCAVENQIEFWEKW